MSVVMAEKEKTKSLQLYIPLNLNREVLNVQADLVEKGKGMNKADLIVMLMELGLRTYHQNDGEVESVERNAVKAFNLWKNMTVKKREAFRKKVRGWIGKGVSDLDGMYEALLCFNAVWNDPDEGMAGELERAVAENIEGDRKFIGNFEVKPCIKNDYSNDPAWSTMQQRMEALRESIKKREAFLDKVPEPIEGVSPMTENIGDETVELRPPAKIPCGVIAELVK